MTIIIPGSGDKPRKRERTMRPAKQPRSARKNYLDELDRQVGYLKAQTANLSQLISTGADRALVAQSLASLSAQAQARFDQLAPNTAANFIGQVSTANKETIQKSIASALSVDFATIIDGTDVGAILDMTLGENVALIRSISAEHFAEVGRAVLDNYRGVPLPGDVSLTKRLQDIGGITKNRAKFIARDQTSKLTGNLNQARMQENGIDEYIWRTARDERVVGTPGGKYPKGTRGHGNHYEREGETFSWQTPPSDGHPGQAYNCRCYAEPKLNIDKLKAQYV